MNIFVLDEDPVQCVKYPHDKHVVKMILETAFTFFETEEDRDKYYGY